MAGRRSFATKAFLHRSAAMMERIFSVNGIG
jgi:hypothetical protein